MATAEALASDAPVAWRRRLRLPEALPNLSGPWRKLFLILWLLALPAAIVAPVAGSYLAYRSGAAPAWRPLGLVVTTDQAVRIAHLTSREARTSGLRKGDIIVAIDGRQVPADNPAAVRSRLEKPEGAAVVLSVRSQDGSSRDASLTRRASHEVEGTGVGPETLLWIRLVPPLIAALSLVAAAILLFRRRRDTMAAILSLSLLLIAATVFAVNFWAAHGAAAIAGPVGDVGWCALMLVLLTFPSGRFVPRWTAAVALFLPIMWLGSAFLLPTLTNLAYTAVLAISVGALSVRYRRLPTGPERQQLRWVFLGFAFGTVLIATAILADAAFEALIAIDQRWVVWGPLIFYPLGSLGIVSYAVGLIVSILRYRLYDADQVISRSAGYAVLTVLLAGTFAASAKGMELFFESYFGGEAGAVPGAVGAGLAVALITPLHNRIHRWAERRFQKELTHLRRDLPECVGDLRETAGLEQLLAAVLARIEAGVRATRSAVLLRDGQNVQVAATRNVDAAACAHWSAGWRPAPNAAGLDCDSADPLFPLRIALTVETGVEPETIGWILLGPRPDGSFYGKDEQEALAEIADPVARAVRIVVDREGREHRQEARLAALERKLARALKALRPAGGPRS